MLTPVILAVLGVLGYTQLTIFVIQPIGAVPEGKTLVILRMNKTEFIDSTDAICFRKMGRRVAAVPARDDGRRPEQDHHPDASVL